MKEILQGYVRSSFWPCSSARGRPQCKPIRTSSSGYSMGRAAMEANSSTVQGHCLGLETRQGIEYVDWWGMPTSVRDCRQDGDDNMGPAIVTAFHDSEVVT